MFSTFCAVSFKEVPASDVVDLLFNTSELTFTVEVDTGRFSFSFSTSLGKKTKAFCDDSVPRVVVEEVRAVVAVIIVEVIGLKVVVL